MLAEAIYSELARRFDVGSVAAKTLTQLASEEMQHAERIRMLALDCAQDAEIEGDLPRQVSALVTDAETILKKVKQSEPMPFSAVLELCLRLEARFSQVHANVMAGSINPALQNLFRNLAKQDKQHEALLSAAKKHYSGR